MRIFLILVTLTVSSQLFAKADICKVANFARCRSIFGSVMSSIRSIDGISFPDFSSAIAVNPSKVMKNRGFGVESIAYNGDYSFGV